MIQNRVVAELNKELELSSEPGYSSRYDEEYFDGHKSSKSNRSSNRNSNENTEPEKKTEPVKTERTDAATDIPPTPHKPNQDVGSGRSKPAAGEFGKGVFD